MNIFIVGAGEVGKHLAKNLSNELHNITLIDSDERTTDDLRDELDAKIVCDNGSSARVLAEHNITDCELFLAVTQRENTNLVAAAIAKKLGARKTIARLQAGVELDMLILDVRDFFGIDHLFNLERLAALKLAKHVSTPEQSLRTEDIERGRIELQQLNVSKKSEWLDRPIAQFDLPKGVRIATLHRADRTLFPNGSDHLEAGDLVTLFGTPNVIQKIIRKINPAIPQPRKKNVVIAGGGGYGLMLYQILRSDAKIRIMDKNKNECARLSHSAAEADIIHGDATSLSVLQEEQVGEADFFVAATADDEDNVMACLQADTLGDVNCLALIHRPDTARVIENNRQRLGILAVVSPRIESGKELMRFVENPNKYHHIVDLKPDVEIIQVVIPENSRIAEKKVSEIVWPEGGSLIGRVQGLNAEIPTGDTVLQAEDAVYLAVTSKSRMKFVRFISQ